MTVLVEFLYSTSLPKELSSNDFHSLYRLADAFGMPSFLNRLMDYIQAKHATSGTYFEPKEISSIHANRAVGNGQLWAYCCAQITGLLMWGKAEAKWIEGFKCRNGKLRAATWLPKAARPGQPPSMHRRCI